jgi:hypothetical protein
LPWQTKLDSGWSNYDLEIFGHPWSRLRLTTVTEELEQGKRSFRCRCQSMWSLRAWIVFWAGLGAELSLISYLAPMTPWIWMLLLAAPLLLWHLEEEEQWLRLAVEESLDEAASQLQLVKL